MSNYIIDPNQNFGPVPPPVTRNAWIEIGRTTLGAPADVITVVIPRKRYLKVIYKIKAVSGTMEMNERFNSDVGNNYANRRSINGAADVPLGNNDKIDIQSGVPVNWKFFGIQYIDNDPTGEKLVTDHDMSDTGVLGAGAAPWRQDLLGKWSNLVDQITQIDITNNAGTGDYDTGSEVVVLGFDPADGGDATQNFWLQLGSVEVVPPATPTTLLLTIAKKRYLWIEAYANTTDVPASGWALQVGDTVIDSGPNYALRSSFNDGGDSTAVGFPRIPLDAGSGFNEQAKMQYMVYNDSAEEKFVLLSGQQTIQQPGTPFFVFEGVAKWDSIPQNPGGGQVDRVAINRLLGGGVIRSGFIRVWGHD